MQGGLPPQLHGDVLEGREAPPGGRARAGFALVAALVVAAVLLADRLPSRGTAAAQPIQLSAVVIGQGERVPQGWTSLVQLTARDGGGWDLLDLALGDGPWRPGDTVTSLRRETHTVTVWLTLTCQEVRRLRAPRWATVTAHRSGARAVSLLVPVDGEDLLERPRADCARAAD